MSDPNRPREVPPDLPPEYAEAYRRGYESAVQQAGGSGLDELDQPEVQPAVTGDSRPLYTDELGSAGAQSSTGAHRAEPEQPLFDGGFFDEETDEDSRAPRERPAWLVPALLAGLVVVLLLGAYGIGRVVSGNLAGTDVKQAEPDGVVIGEDGSTAGSGSAEPSNKPGGKPYAGTTDTAPIGGASATCQSGNGVDSAGNLVSYSPGNVYDEDMTTAWRCDGDGTGQQLTVDLAGKTRIGEVGLVPGYAKTDARSGIDRYAENDRITRVRWVFDDGTTVEQSFDAAVSNRSMQSMRIPVTRARKVVVEVLDSERGDRNTIAVSELRIGAVAR
jgi:hypothetical protein